MKKLIKTACGLALIFSLTYCKNDDNATTVVVRDRVEVYQENLTAIETFLKGHSITIEDNGVSFTEVSDSNDPNSIWNQNTYTLQSIALKNDSRSTTDVYKSIDDSVEYKVYYLIINEGGGESVTTFDNHFTSYNVYGLNKSRLDFNSFGFWSSFPTTTTANGVLVISGYRQIVTKIKTAAGVIDHTDGTYSYDNPGRIVAFIPSGLGYFENGSGNISSYQPLIFDIKLIDKKEMDHDNDGLLTKYEDVNGNGDFWDDDTDGDGVPNFLDLDDDADGKTTKEEITYTTTDENGNEIKALYSFDEIPTCTNGSVKKHLDKSCQ